MHQEKPLIEIRTSALVEGVNELDFTCKPSDFHGRQFGQASFAGEVRVLVSVRKSDEEITITISTSAKADFTCDRCLAPVSQVLCGTVDLFYTFSTPVFGQEDGSYEYRQIAKSTENIDLSEDVCDALFLSLPIKVTCSGNPDCRLYRSEKSVEKIRQSDETSPGEKNEWQESLEKLKSKYC